eukprot:gene510-280_t
MSVGRGSVRFLHYCLVYLFNYFHCRVPCGLGLGLVLCTASSSSSARPSTAPAIHTFAHTGSTSADGRTDTHICTHGRQEKINKQQGISGMEDSIQFSFQFCLRIYKWVHTSAIQTFLLLHRFIRFTSDSLKFFFFLLKPLKRSKKKKEMKKGIPNRNLCQCVAGVCEAAACVVISAPSIHRIWICRVHGLPSQLHVLHFSSPRLVLHSPDCLLFDFWCSCRAGRKRTHI